MLETCIQTHISIPKSPHVFSEHYFKGLYFWNVCSFPPRSSLFLCFLQYSVCKDGFTKTCEIRGPEGNGVPCIYRLTHVNFNFINSQVFVSFFFFIFSLTPLHWRIILYFPNVIKCIFFLKSINYRFFASNIYNSCIFPSVMNWYYFLIFLWNKCITQILLYTYRFSYS